MSDALTDRQHVVLRELRLLTLSGAATRATTVTENLDETKSGTVKGVLDRLVSNGMAYEYIDRRGRSTYEPTPNGIRALALTKQE